MESPIPTVLSSSEVLGDSEVAAAAAMVRELMEVIETVGSYAGFRKTQRKDCLNLVRRLKLLVPLLEEIKDQVGNPLGVSGSGMDSLVSLKKALLGAKKFKIYLVNHLAMESEAVLSRFHGVYDKLNQALDGMPYDELGVSVEVKEQVNFHPFLLFLFLSTQNLLSLFFFSSSFFCFYLVS
ncbi:hypothetical protein GOBAR_AA04231 [Gossypium barbadense]|uniref:PUB 12/19-like N-terminal domain-containing protein n=1 Tax=Gossypium barbadense TaxID=3634 RepID=A0A2P5YLC9_GOSBA|nr:hypothetical protein GOBAR_AA04231 [Gossypium barbadense]